MNTITKTLSISFSLAAVGAFLVLAGCQPVMLPSADVPSADQKAYCDFSKMPNQYYINNYNDQAKVAPSQAQTLCATNFGAWTQGTPPQA